jgi:hypothetical protein
MVLRLIANTEEKCHVIYEKFDGVGVLRVKIEIKDS